MIVLFLTINVDFHENLKYEAEKSIYIWNSSADPYTLVSLYREFLALNVYVALCYYKLDYYDVSQVDLTSSHSVTNKNSYCSDTNGFLLNFSSTTSIFLCLDFKISSYDFRSGSSSSLSTTFSRFYCCH